MSDLPTADRGPAPKSRIPWLQLIALPFLVPAGLLALYSLGGAGIPGSQFDPIALALAAPLLAFGVGLWRERRWAVFMTRVLARLLVAGGFAILPVLLMFVGVDSDASGQPAGISSSMAFMFNVIVLGMIALPAAILWLLARQDVRHLIETRDRGPSRTDRLDPDVVGLALGMLGVGLAYMKGIWLFAISPDSVLPTIAMVLCIVLFSTIMSLLLFRRRRAGWWCALLVLLLPIVFRAISGLMGARLESPTVGPPLTPEMLDALSFSPRSQFLGVLSALPWLIWLSFARGRFRTAPDPAPSGPTAPLGSPPEPAGPAPDAATED